MYTSSKHTRPCLRLYNKYCDISCMLHGVLDFQHRVWLDMKWHIGCRYITVEHNNLNRRKKRHISTLENSTTSSFIRLRVTVYQNRKQWVRFLRANVLCKCIYLLYLPLQLASFNFQNLTSRYTIYIISMVLSIDKINLMKLVPRKVY